MEGHLLNWIVFIPAIGALACLIMPTRRLVKITAVAATAITLLLFAFTGGNSAIIGKGLTGAVLIGVILFMPEGLLGQALKWWGARRAAKDSVAVAPSAAHVATASPTSRGSGSRS